MLTNKDLLEIQKIVKVITKQVVREEIEAEGQNIRDDIGGDLATSKIIIQQEIRDLGGRIKNLEIRSNKIEGGFKKGFLKLDKGFKKLFDFLDRDQLGTKKRVERIEKHLGLTEIDPQQL